MAFWMFGKKARLQEFMEQKERERQEQEDQRSNRHGSIELYANICASIRNSRSDPKDMLTESDYHRLERSVFRLLLTILAMQTSGIGTPKDFRPSNDNLQLTTYNFCKRVMYVLWDALSARGIFAAKLHLLQLTLSEGSAVLTVADARGSSSEGVSWPVVHTHRLSDAVVIGSLIGHLLASSVLTRNHLLGEPAIDLTEQWSRAIQGNVEAAIRDAEKNGGFGLVIQVFNREVAVMAQAGTCADVYHRDVFLPPDVLEHIKKDDLMTLSNHTTYPTAMWYVANRQAQESTNRFDVFPTPTKRRARKPNGQYARSGENPTHD